ncbi:MAG: hypothetical protein PHQ43_03975 [Dehalococcoidales bacterium]|nr:hypothetical protein [Dehalococcoidales bacterium]
MMLPTVLRVMVRLLPTGTIVPTVVKNECNKKIIVSESNDFWQADLGRIVGELDKELSTGYPDWERVLLKADDLTALALAAIKGSNKVKKCKTPSKSR